MSKAADAFRTISEVADDLEVPKHVLRFWENRFPQIKPMKRGGGRRYYRPADLELLRGIRHLLHNAGYTIKGVQKIIREQGVEIVKTCWQPGQDLRLEASGRSAPASAETRSEPPAGKRRKGKAQPPGAAHGNRATAIAAIITELQACRALLTEAASTQPRATRAKATRTARRA